MFLSCPNCSKFFKIPPKHLLPDGKKVRCSACKHVWFQEPLTKEDLIRQKDKLLAMVAEKEAKKKSETNAQAGGDDPDSALKASMMASLNQMSSSEKNKQPEQRHPIAEKIAEKIVAPIQDIVSALRVKLDGHMLPIQKYLTVRTSTGLLSFIIVVFIACYSFVHAREFIVLHYPKTYNVYAGMGYDVIAPGTNLILKDVEPVWGFDATGQPVLSIEGAVLNTSDSGERHIPPLKATLLLDTGKSVSSHIVALENPILAAGKERSFTLFIPEWPEGANGVLLSFAVDLLN
jgi:predicted Zn finger-like uncharacterized protein